MDFEELEDAIARARTGLLELQRDDGHWCGEAQISVITESLFILLLAILKRQQDPCIPKLARYIASGQNEDGGWSTYPGGPADLSLSVEAYFALKLAGHDPTSPLMARAREKILALGGASEVMSFRRFFLAALGQVPYSHCVSVPAELILLPTDSPLSIFGMSSWTRPWVVRAAVFDFFKPVTALPSEAGIDELFLPGTRNRKPKALRLQRPFFSGANGFRLVDRLAKFYGRWMPRRWRRGAIEAVRQHILERSRSEDGLPSLYFSMVFTILSLRCFGSADDGPELQGTEQLLRDLFIEDDETIRIQPCFSPVWDTAWAVISLVEAGVPPEDSAIEEAVDWLLQREIRQPGDWAVRRPELEPGAWAFQYFNPFYPDLDDTALVLQAFQHAAKANEPAFQEATRRGVAFLKGMQSKDHGWAAFEPDTDHPLLENLPFADHHAMLDPSCADITGRVLETMAGHGLASGTAEINEVVEFLFKNQEPEGCWVGRWGVHYLYGTWHALAGLDAIGHPIDDPRVRAASAWIKSVQQADGGWGEACSTYANREMMGRGEEPTPSQTAWAVLGLTAAGEADSDEARRGAAWLMKNQHSDGTWCEDAFTGTGFPEVVYLRYDFYRLYFPLLALTRYRMAQADPICGSV